MASIYKPKDKKNWYISFVDPDTGKARNRSTGLSATKNNLKHARRLLKEIEEVLQSKKDLYLNHQIQHATITDAFAEFLKLNSDKHKKTIEGYGAFYELFSKTFDLNQPCTVINKLSAESWIVGIKTLPKAKNTIYSYFKVFNKFLNFLFEYSYLPVFKVNKSLKPRPEIKNIIVFKKDDLQKIIDGLENKNSNFATIILVMVYTGLRASDILDIKAEDIDFEEMMIKYYSTKTKQHLRIPFHENLKEVLTARISTVQSGYIFQYSTYGEVGKAFRRYLKELGFTDKQYGLRTFRKHFATVAYENDVSLMTAAKLLGHKNISTTMKYYTYAGQKKLLKDVNKMKFDESGE